MILVDTSVWIDHFRSPETHLREHLTAGRVLTHSMVIGEIACGNLPNRRETLQRMESLARIVESDHRDVLSMIESRQLMGRGVGFVDAHLILFGTQPGRGVTMDPGPAVEAGRSRPGDCVSRRIRRVDESGIRRGS